MLDSAIDLGRTVWEWGWSNQGAALAILAVLGWATKQAGLGLVMLGTWLMRPTPVAPEVKALLEAIRSGLASSLRTAVTLPAGALRVSVDGSVRDDGNGEDVSRYYSDRERRQLATAVKARLAEIDAQERAATRRAVAEVVAEGNGHRPTA
jgi:hypothetical protein